MYPAAPVSYSKIAMLRHRTHTHTHTEPKSAPVLPRFSVTAVIFFFSGKYKTSLKIRKTKNEEPKHTDSEIWNQQYIKTMEYGKYNYQANQSKKQQQRHLKHLSTLAISGGKKDSSHWSISHFLQKYKI